MQMNNERAQQLAALKDQRLRWKGTINRWSQRLNKNDKRGASFTTVLLIDVSLMDDERDAQFDHTWVRGGLWHHGLKIGDTIIFNATVMPYRRGDPRYVWDDSNIEIDYRLHKINTVVKTRRKEE